MPERMRVHIENSECMSGMGLTQGGTWDCCASEMRSGKSSEVAEMCMTCMLRNGFPQEKIIVE